ncbi:MAG: dTDP-glucose 4,6-dehydratase [Actinomycetota bacterium]
MRLFVTGGAGFIGSNFIRHVLSAYPDDEVTNFDLLSYAANPESLADIAADPRYRFVRGDICDGSALSEAMQGHDAVVNFAAETHVDRSILDAAPFVRTNVLGVQVLLEAVRRLGIARMLHVSTDEVYGSIDVGSFREADSLSPNSPYAASKASADLMCRAYAVTHGLDVVVTRSSNNFGPYQFPEKVLPLFVTNLLADQPVPVYGDGRNIRDWCYVEDNCAGVDLVLRKGAAGEIYNIGAGNEISNLELTGRLLAIMGKPESMIRFVPDRPGHDLRYSVDTSKVRALGWKPSRDLDDALERTAGWYRDNEWWWRPLKDRASAGALPTTKV